MRYKHILVASAVAMFKTIPESCEVSTRQEQSAFANAFSIQNLLIYTFKKNKKKEKNLLKNLKNNPIKF